MDNQPAVPNATPTPGGYPVFRIIAAAAVAAVIAFAVSALGRRESWPYTQSISLAAFLFLIPVLQPIALRQRTPWSRRLIFGVIAAVIGGLLYFLVLGR
jgi:hypothetical protein